MEETQNQFNSFNLIRFIWKWRKELILVSFIAAVLALGITFLIRPQYKSTSIIYAPRTNSIAKILMGPHGNERLDIKAYAVEEETEHMMQLLTSRELKDVIIEKFNLVEHYGLNPNMKHWRHRLYKTVNNQFTVKRTQYGAISITVSDWDSQLAADICNEIVVQLDTFKNRIERERATIAYQTLEKQLEDADREIRRIDDSLLVIAQNGVLVLEKQTERLTQQLAIAIAQGNQGARERLEKEMEKLTKWGPIVQTLHNEQFHFSQYHSLARSKMMDAKIDMESNMPVKFVVEKAIPADKKYYPKRLITMILASLGAFTVTLFGLLIAETIDPEFSFRKKKSRS